MGVPSLLGQQELLAVPPARRLIVPVGHSAWYGVDLGTTRLAVAYVDAEGRRASATAPFASLKGSARLSVIYAQTRLFMGELLDGGWPAPGVVLTEQPSGSKQSVNLPFIMAAGAIHAGLYDGLRDAVGHPVVIEECVSGHWKRVACGSGRIYKPQRRRGEPPVPLIKYGVFLWALENGWAPRDWNEADAAGMADCARREIGLDER